MDLPVGTSGRGGGSPHTEGAGAGPGPVALQRRQGDRDRPSRRRPRSPGVGPAESHQRHQSPRGSGGLRRLRPGRRSSRRRSRPAGRTAGSPSTGTARRITLPAPSVASTSPARPSSSSWSSTTMPRSGWTGSFRWCWGRPAASSSRASTRPTASCSPATRDRGSSSSSRSSASTARSPGRPRTSSGSARRRSTSTARARSARRRPRRPRWSGSTPRSTASCPRGGDREARGRVPVRRGPGLASRRLPALQRPQRQHDLSLDAGRRGLGLPHAQRLRRRRRRRVPPARLQRAHLGPERPAHDQRARQQAGDPFGADWSRSRCSLTGTRGSGSTAPTTWCIAPTARSTSPIRRSGCPRRSTIRGRSCRSAGSTW